MNYYTVQQVKIPESEQDLPNQVESWADACAISPHWNAKMEMMRVSHQEGEMQLSDDILDCFHDCYLVQAADLEDVFRITNLWDKPDAVHTYTPGHSTSVGDIIVDNATGQKYVVADFGFNKLAA
jgi:alpha-D-ribose 1-methylphosphonate 5-phosphate C-P lyase